MTQDKDHAAASDEKKTAVKPARKPAAKRSSTMPQVKAPKASAPTSSTAASTDTPKAKAPGRVTAKKSPAKAPASSANEAVESVPKPSAKSRAKAPAKNATAKTSTAQEAAVPTSQVEGNAVAKSAPKTAAKAKAPARPKPAPEAKPTPVGEKTVAASSIQPSQASRPQREGRAPQPQKQKQEEALVAPVPFTPTQSQVVTDAAVSSPVTGDVTAMPEGDAGEAAKRKRRSRRGGRRRNKKHPALSAEQQNGDPEGGQATESATDQQEAGTQAVNAAATSFSKPSGNEQRNALPATGKTVSARDDDFIFDDDDDDDIDAPVQQAPKSASKGKGRGRRVRDDDDDDDAPPADRKMLVSVLSGEQVEVVLLEDNMVQEYYVEMQHQVKVKGNIYKGTVSNVDPNLQAAFISYAGGVKNGFLQIDEVHPEYYQTGHEGKGRKYPLIQKVLKPGQEILVQVVKEPAGSKGAFLTSYLSLPGRYLVLTPGREQVGVSRKVENEEERGRLRELLNGLNPGIGLGVIVRTASMGTSKTNLQRDLQFLKRLWKEVRERGKKEQAPALIYQELDLSTRAMRDYLTDAVKEVWVDDEATALQVSEFAALLSPKRQDSVHIHNDVSNTLFERFGIQKQLTQIHAREVTLPSGGRLVFDPTEALTAIDINSGRSGGKNNFEDMAYRTNLEAARMIPLQLRLRDIGGQVVIDFIEMRDRDHWRDVEKAMRNGMKGDRARYDIGKVSSFGLLELVRQRLGSSAISISTEPCPCCKGTGVRRNMEWQALQSLKDIQKLLRQAVAQNQPKVVYQVESELAIYLLNAKRQMFADLEKQHGVQIIVSPGE